MKAGSIRDPEFYLGAKLRQMTLPNGVRAWGMSSSKYIQAAVANVKAYHSLHFPTRPWAKRTSSPFLLQYTPELDTTPELNSQHASFYQTQIGVLRWIVYDPSYPTIDMTSFKECDWKAFYGNVEEAIPPNAPKPRGKDVDLRMFVDSDHAGDKRTRRLQSGFIIYLNMAPINWYSKKQSTIETSVFSAQFVAMKQGMETLRVYNISFE
ncbi:hypothetical protein MHU86_13705 [Fragilaria crotonensis]|nr:hypothetical protein MHU86_13705 [Fragilaria crotonensis]